MNSYDKIRNAVFNLCEKYASEIAGLYDNAIMEISELMKGVELDEEQPFNFEDYGIQEKVDDIMDRLEASVMKKVGDGVLAAYAMSYKNCEELVRRVVGEKVGEDVRKAFLPKIRSNSAAKAFMKNVPSISGRLWNGETLALMTSAVEDGISQGMSAKKMASRIKEYLNDPNDWHRRFRYKIGEDEDGNSVLGRKWKKREWDESEKRYKWVDHKPGEPHPGHVGGPGAYRSSYKNALRYTRTTINIAYRTADYDQYQSLPFVRGIEILLSNNHPIPDICDDLAGMYPKDFKWTGWHPNCRCYQIPVLAKPEEVDKMVDSILDGGEAEDVNVKDVVNDLPDNFKKWAKDNEERMVEAGRRGTLPYFIRDNSTTISKMLKEEGFGKDAINDIFSVNKTLSRNIVEERRTSYISFLANKDYMDVMFNEQNGGLIATHKKHNFDHIRGDYEKQVQSIGYRTGHSVILTKEEGLPKGLSYIDGMWDGKPFEIAGAETGTPNNIKKALNHCASKDGVKIAVVYFPQASPSIDNIDMAINRYYNLAAKGANGTVKFDVIYFIGDGKIIKTYKI